MWFLKAFITLVSSNALAISDGIQAILTVIFALSIVKFLGDITFKKIYIVWILSYTGLLALFISPTTFLICSTFSSAAFLSIITIFKNNLNAQNITNSERAMYDNYQFILQNIFRMFGSCIAYISILPTVPFYYVWIAVYIAFDIDLILTVLLVKTNKLKYSVKQKENSK